VLKSIGSYCVVVVGNEALVSFGIFFGLVGLDVMLIDSFDSVRQREALLWDRHI